MQDYTRFLCVRTGAVPLTKAISSPERWSVPGGSKGAKSFLPNSHPDESHGSAGRRQQP